MLLTIRKNPEAKPQSMVTVGSRAAGVTLDGGESGGNPALSADAVAFCVRVLTNSGIVLAFARIAAREVLARRK